MRNILTSIVFSVTLTLSMLFSCYVRAEEPAAGGYQEKVALNNFKFLIRRAEFVNETVTLPGATEEGPEERVEEVDVLAITYDIFNDSANRKIDLSEPLQFILRDEFGNIYNTLPKPDAYSRMSFFPNKHYPSLYPDEFFSETVFFEAPVSQSRQLFMDINAMALGFPEVIKLKIPNEKIVSQEEGRADHPSDADLTILFPQQQKPVLPGDVLYVEVKFSDRVRVPDSVYVLSPSYTYEDQYAAYRYNVRIPRNQRPGPYTVVVMAQWGNKSKPKYSVSKSVTVNVISPDQS